MSGVFLRAQVRGGNIGDVVGISAQEASLRVIVESPSAEVKRLAQHAFSFHGGFELRSSGRVDFVFNFEPVGDAALDLSISSGGQELLRQRFAAATMAKAFALAADTAVKRTTNLPGWFSGTLVFVSNRSGYNEIYISDMLLQHASQLTHDRSQSILPTIAPDASQILYTGYFRNGFPDLYAIDLKTQQRKIFASFRGMNSGAKFSKDGRSVALILSGSGNAEVYSANAMGGQFQRLTRTASLEADPDWSADGSQIAFTSDEMGRPQIFVMNADGSGRRRLPTNVSRNCSEAVWNPLDSRVIAFTAAVGNEFEVCLYTMGGADARIITRGVGDAVDPIWLPDGRHLIVTLRSGESSRLAILDSKTGKQVSLTPPSWGRCGMADFAPAFRP